MLGWSNLVIALVAGVPVSHSYKAAIVMQQAGAKSRCWVFVFGLSYMLLYFVTSIRSIFAFVPRCAYGGLVMSLGIEFLYTSVIDSKASIGSKEWYFVIFTAVAVYFNVLLGICFGVLCTTIFFVVEYSKMTGVTNKATLQEVRSLVERSAVENAILERHGRRVAVFWCSGYIFFGTASSIREEVEAYLEGEPRTKHIILDFEMVPAVDASGLHVLGDFVKECLQTRQPRVCVTFSGLVRKLHAAMARKLLAQEPHMDGLFLTSSRVEVALEQAEVEILKASSKRLAASAGLQCLSEAFFEGGFQSAIAMRLASKLARCSNEAVTSMEVLDELLEVIAPSASKDDRTWIGKQLAIAGAKVHRFDDNSLIFKEGDKADSLLYIVDGAVSLTRLLDRDHQPPYKLSRFHLDEAKGDHFSFEESSEIRVRRVIRGTVVGVVEFGAAKDAVDEWPQRAMSAWASPQCIALIVPFEALHRALASSKAVGFEVMAWLNQLTSAQVLDLFRHTNVKPFRRVSQHMAQNPMSVNRTERP